MIAETSPTNPSNSRPSQVFKATFHQDGVSFDIPPNTSLLQAAELTGLQMASSCRNGTCRTCICQLVGGEVFHSIEWPGLSLDEKRDGLILACVAYPLSDIVIELPS